MSHTYNNNAYVIQLPANNQETVIKDGFLQFAKHYGLGLKLVKIFRT